VGSIAGQYIGCYATNRTEKYIGVKTMPSLQGQKAGGRALMAKIGKEALVDRLHAGAARKYIAENTPALLPHFDKQLKLKHETEAALAAQEK